MQHMACMPELAHTRHVQLLRQPSDEASTAKRIRFHKRIQVPCSAGLHARAGARLWIPVMHRACGAQQITHCT